VSDPLASLAAEDGRAPEQLRRWLDLLIASKRGKVLDDPELFATYVKLTADAREVVLAHVENLVAQLTRIIAKGVERGEFDVPDPVAAARAVFDATSRFHNPAHALEWSDPGIDAAFEGVWFLVLAGLGARRGSR
jgi:transposase-like protein